jgi:DNA-directed RNA polymerase omega subunit
MSDYDREGQLKVKPSIERYSIDKCLENAGGNRFDLILLASQRARDIANKRIFAGRTNKNEYENKPTTQALIDIEQGEYTREDLLSKYNEK